MKVKEILSHHINEDFGVVYVDFIIEDGNQEKEINNFEILEEDLLDVCELYESKEWVDWETNDNNAFRQISKVDQGFIPL